MQWFLTTVFSLAFYAEPLPDLALRTIATQYIVRANLVGIICIPECDGSDYLFPNLGLVSYRQRHTVLKLNSKGHI